MPNQSSTPAAQLLRLPAVIERVGLGRSSIYRKEAEGQFPKRVRISERATAWLAADIDQWIADRVKGSQP